MTLLAKICIGIGVAGIAIMVALGERTLSVFDGDRELAARVYATTAMIFGSLIVAGAFHFIAHTLSRFLVKMIEINQRLFDADSLWMRTTQWFQNARFEDIFYVLSIWGPVVLFLAGIVMSIHIWYTY